MIGSIAFICTAMKRLRPSVVGTGCLLPCIHHARIQLCLELQWPALTQQVRAVCQAYRHTRLHNACCNNAHCASTSAKAPGCCRVPDLHSSRHLCLQPPFKHASSKAHMWFQAGRCGASPQAPPGGHSPVWRCISRHEEAAAENVQCYSQANTMGLKVPQKAQALQPGQDSDQQQPCTSNWSKGSGISVLTLHSVK